MSNITADCQFDLNSFDTAVGIFWGLIAGEMLAIYVFYNWWKAGLDDSGVSAKIIFFLMAALSLGLSLINFLILVVAEKTAIDLKLRFVVAFGFGFVTGTITSTVGTLALKLPERIFIHNNFQKKLYKFAILWSPITYGLAFVLIHVINELSFYCLAS